MSDMIFVNLPVSNLEQSKSFYSALGFENNPVFTDETAACMVLNEHFAVMLISHPRWNEFKTPLDRAMRSAENQGMNVLGLFRRSTENSGGRPMENYYLSRFAAIERKNAEVGKLYEKLRGL